jgi:hypothetical protein
MSSGVVSTTVPMVTAEEAQEDPTFLAETLNRSLPGRGMGAEGRLGSGMLGWRLATARRALRAAAAMAGCVQDACAARCARAQRWSLVT